MNSSAYQVGATNQVKCDILCMRDDVLNSSVMSTDSIQNKTIQQRSNIFKGYKSNTKSLFSFPLEKSAIISRILESSSPHVEKVNKSTSHR